MYSAKAKYAVRKFWSQAIFASEMLSSLALLRTVRLKRLIYSSWATSGFVKVVHFTQKLSMYVVLKATK